MANVVVLLVNAQTINSAHNQVAQGSQGLLAGDTLGVGTQETDSQGLLIEAGGVESLVVPATTLENSTIVANAKVVGDVGPAEDVGVQTVQVTHLGGTVSEVVAVVTSRVMNDDPLSRLVGEGSSSAVLAAPSRFGDDLRAH